MVTVDYTGTHEWPISVPAEPPHDRRLEARDVDCGAVRAQWEWDEECWVGPGAHESFYGIVAMCAEHGWTLHSLRVVDPIDAGTAAMVAKQAELKASLNAFVEPEQDEWRRIFRAGLDAFHAAGGTA